MPSKEKDEQDSSDSETDKESRSDKDEDGEGQISAIKKKSGEPDDNLRRRAEWFQKRHRG
jgi:hypothetical protein